MRLAIDLLENIQPLAFVLDDAPHARLHQLVPDCRIVVVGEALGRGDGPFDHRLQSRIALLIRMRDPVDRHGAKSDPKRNRAFGKSGAARPSERAPH